MTAWANPEFRSRLFEWMEPKLLRACMTLEKATLPEMVRVRWRAVNCEDLMHMLNNRSSRTSVSPLLVIILG